MLGSRDIVKAVVENARENGIVLTQTEADAAIKGLKKVITNELANGNKISIADIGSFTPVERAARSGINALTGKPYQSQAHMAPKFTPSKTLKDAMLK